MFAVKVPPISCMLQILMQPRVETKVSLISRQSHITSMPHCIVSIPSKKKFQSKCGVEQYRHFNWCYKTPKVSEKLLSFLFYLFIYFFCLKTRTKTIAWYKSAYNESCTMYMIFALNYWNFVISFFIYFKWLSLYVRSLNGDRSDIDSKVVFWGCFF